MTFKPSQNGAMTNVGFSTATIDAFLSRMQEGRIDDICADTGKRKSPVSNDDGTGGAKIIYNEAPERPPLSPSAKLQIALLTSAIEDSFRLTPVVGTEWYDKEFYLARYEKFAKRWLRGETGSGHNRDDNSEVPYYTAKDCFETVGIDYNKALARLEAAWLKHGHEGGVVVKKSRRAGGGGGTQHATVNE